MTTLNMDATDVWSMKKNMVETSHGKPDKRYRDLGTPLQYTISPALIYERFKIQPIKNLNDYASPNDFKDSPKLAVSGFQEILKLLANTKSLQVAEHVEENAKITKDLRDSDSGSRLADTTMYGLLLCLEHFQSNTWTSQETNDLAKQVIDQLLILNRCMNVQQLLLIRFGKKPLARLLFDEYNKGLLKETWKNIPAMMSSAIIISSNIHFPDMSDYLGDVFRLCLLLMDDFEEDNKLSGILLAHHLIKNCTKAELRWNGMADVLYHSLQHQLYLNSSTLLNSLLSCLLQITLIVSDDPKRFQHGVIRTPQKLDEILHRILVNMELEVKQENQAVYAQHLQAFIQHMGVCSLRHIHHLKTVFKMYLEEGLPHTELLLSTLKALQQLFIEAWPRMKKYIPGFFQSLAKVAISLDGNDDKNQQKQLSEAIKDVIRVMHPLAPEQVKDYSNELKNCLVTTGEMYFDLEF